MRSGTQWFAMIPATERPVGIRMIHQACKSKRNGWVVKEPPFNVLHTSRYKELQDH